MFTQTVEYALRIAVCLASSDPQPRTADDLARMTHVPRAYLAKVIQAMVRGGTARSKRGVGGGVALAKSPDELTLLDVINSVDPIKRPAEYPVSENGDGAELGGLHRRFERAVAAVELAFGEETLAEIVAESRKPEERERGGEGENDGTPASRKETPHLPSESNGHSGMKSTLSPMAVAVGNATAGHHHGVTERSTVPGMA